MKIFLPSCILIALTATAQAGPRSSPDYNLTTDTVDAGGRHAMSADYTNDGSAGGVGGLSTVASPAEVAKHGYIGQLYDVAEMVVLASPATVNEGATRQLTATAEMDDATMLIVNPGDVAWSTSSAALSGISTLGLATAANVYQHEIANVNGSYMAVNDPDGFDLTVLNVGLDDFGTYAGDGIDDDWQVDFFGIDSPDAGPGENPDGDADDNTREFLFGFSPLDPTDFTRLTIVEYSGTTVDLQLNKAIPERTYKIMATTDLQVAFAQLGPTFNVVSPETDKLLEDIPATGDTNFYQVEASKP